MVHKTVSQIVSGMFAAMAPTLPSRLRLVLQNFGEPFVSISTSPAVLRFLGIQPGSSTVGINCSRCSYLLIANGFVSCFALTRLGLSMTYTEAAMIIGMLEVRLIRADICSSFTIEEQVVHISP